MFALVIVLASSVNAATVEVIDQHSDYYGGSRNIGLFSPLGQEFTPTMSPLIAVELYVESPIINPPLPDNTITVHIREATIDGNILGTASRLASSGFEGWLRFDFPGGIDMTFGLGSSVYVIEVSSSGTTFVLHFSPTDVYLGGRSIVSGAPVATEDQSFRTYSTKETSPSGTSGHVGGEVFSANKLAVLSPYLALFSVIAVAAVLVKRHRT